MEIICKIGSKEYSIDVNAPLDISIALKFNGEQPNTYSVPRATASAYQDGAFVGDIRCGGGCNFEKVTLIPHCNGTHTECIGHITSDRVAITERLPNTFLPATLITVETIPALTCGEAYTPQYKEKDLVVTKKTLVEALKSSTAEHLTALVIRTLPNLDGKKARDYEKQAPAFFTNAAVEYLVSLGVCHLLVDVPSLDRAYDDGKLSSHHVFWELHQGSHYDNKSTKTITEMIFVDNSIADGIYLLNLQVVAFVSDASPSRPVLFKLA